MPLDNTRCEPQPPDDDPDPSWILDYPGQHAVCPYDGNPCHDTCYIGLACDQIAEVLMNLDGRHAA
jgi:hypothetical protein